VTSSHLRASDVSRHGIGPGRALGSAGRTETRNETSASTPVLALTARPAFALVELAVAEGFEPSEAFTSHAFEVWGCARLTDSAWFAKRGRTVPSTSVNGHERTRIETTYETRVSLVDGRSRR
jgi:hypothetical protein